MPEYGFSSADISSITSARAGLTDGFMQLGKQIQEDITRIATVREMKAFGQELAQIDPNSEAFPQQLIGTMSKYPLAMQTPLAKQGIQVLGARYQAGIEAKQEAAKLAEETARNAPYSIGDVNVDPRLRATYRINPETGQTTFIDPTPQTPAPHYSTARTKEGVVTYETSSGEKGPILGELPPVSSASRSQGSGTLAIELRHLENTIKAFRGERQKLIDSLEGPNEQRGSAALPFLKADDPQLLRIKELEKQIQKAGEDQNRLIIEERSTSGFSDTAQGNPALMPAPQQTPFVPMGMPSNIAAPKMTLNTGENYIEPPTLPGIVPPAKQAGTPKLYVVKDGRFGFIGNDPRAAVEQAFADQMITEEKRAEYLSKLK